MPQCSELIAVLILITVTAVFAQDWPQWRGMNRDGKVTGFKAPETWPAELTQKWTVTVGLGDATPALEDNRLYVFTRQEADEVFFRLQQLHEFLVLGKVRNRRESP